MVGVAVVVGVAVAVVVVVVVGVVVAVVVAVGVGVAVVVMFPKTNKFGAKKTLCKWAAHPHPSRLEASVCDLLALRQKAGDIRELKWQHTVHLAFGIKWKVDWSFEQEVRDGTHDGYFTFWQQRFAEAKGVEDRGFKLKLRMWKEGCGPGPLELWRGSYQRPYLDRIYFPIKLRRVYE